MILANQLPIPEPMIIPISKATNAINGIIVFKTVCTDSLAAWLNVATTLPTPIPILAINPPPWPCCVNVLEVSIPSSLSSATSSLVAFSFCCLTIASASSAFTNEICFGVTADTYNSGVMYLAKGPLLPVGRTFTVKIFLLG